MPQKHNLMDRLIINFDKMLKPELYTTNARDIPGSSEEDNQIQMSTKQKQIAIGKLRVNHCGEVCAQALYRGQAITARDVNTKSKLEAAADEEIEHLHWCKHRIKQLGGRTSLLNPAWFIGSFTLGIIAGFAGDKWSLGFLEETEYQVGDHLQSHINSWPEFDKTSLSILKQMQIDELEHANTANICGAEKLPAPIPKLMKYTAKFMTTTATYI